MEMLRILVFELEHQRYGLPLGSVHEVVRAVAITRLPAAPAVVEGAIDLRGRVVPALDLRRRFGLPPREISPRDHLVIASTGGRLVALRVDRADWLVELEPDAVDEAADLGAGRDYVAGVARLPDGLVLIHDLETFLSEAEAATLDRALDEARRADGEER